ncbi:MAG: hypothetical protein JXA10_14445 [Anaerolineae bacterium]|nr:hypothetical protein [Anaerolineae bacterium]
MNRILAYILKVVLLPLRLLGVLGRVLGILFRPVLMRIDSSQDLSNTINSLSSSMASQRGLPLIIGTVLLVLSLIVHGIVIVGLVATDSFDKNLYWLCIPFTILHAGVLAGFTGAMLAIPLGQSYRDQ